MSRPVRGFLRNVFGRLIGAAVQVTAVICCVYAIATFIVRPYFIPSPSMVPTLEVGDVVIVTKYSYGWRPSAYVNVLASDNVGRWLHGTPTVVMLLLLETQPRRTMMPTHCLSSGSSVCPVRKLRSSQEGW